MDKYSLKTTAQCKNEKLRRILLKIKTDVNAFNNYHNNAL